MVMKWILNSLDKSIRDNLKYVRSAAELWGELLEHYGQANAIEVYQLRKDLDAVSQANLSLVEYYNKLKNYWETLNSLDPIPQCSCGKISLCTCTLMKRVITRENNSRLIQFLMGLNSGYDHVRTQVLSMDPLPTINRALGLLQKIEKQKQVVESVEVLAETSAYAAYKPAESHQTDKKSKKHCSHCNMNNHNLDECFWVTGCAYCGKPGHKIEKCYRLVGFPSDKGTKTSNKYSKAKPKTFDGKKGFKKSANNVNVMEEEVPVSDNPLATGSSHASSSQGFFVDPDVMNGLVSSVVDQVLKRINDNVTSLSTSNFASILPISHANVVHHSFLLHDWIIDTGASGHMTFNFALLHNVRVLPKPLSIGLPDGTVKYVTKIGDVCLTDDIVLLNVLFVPDFKQNLLSISKLIDNNKLCVVFSTAACEFQDLSTKKVIATGQRIGDLYRFQNFNTQALVDKVVSLVSKVFECHSCSDNKHGFHSVNSSTSSISAALLHARLGHMGYDKLKFVNTNNGIIKENLPCEICVLSKHHQFPFPISSSKASYVFELLHMDVWGPYNTPTVTGAKYFLIILDDFSRNT
ncbi:uncharacterized protein LOC141641711 [Silene latifolia]|uniref:uncharacterized protein LOC141641711 n=1 Tax=Silene latifolia TaxID=37657 RepID=UPI003D76F956